MDLKPHDLHITLNASARQLKLFDASGQMIFNCETRNRTTADGQYGHDGNCPPGEYVAGLPEHREQIPFGFWFIPVLDYGSHLTMALHKRQGIGIHGGGSGLQYPFKPCQGWQVTHGCWRLQNIDLARLAPLVQRAQQATGRVYVTVLQGVPGASEEPDDWAPLAELAAGE